MYLAMILPYIIPQIVHITAPISLHQHEVLAIKVLNCQPVSMDSLIMEGKQTDFSVLSAVEAILRKQDSTRQEQFLRLLKVLSQNIDEL